MNDQSKKSETKTSADTSDAISSQESPDGNLPSTSQAGQMELFGAEAAPANPSQPQASVKRMKTKDISGRHGSSLSEFADRQQSLANKCRELLAWGGSTEYSMTWKRKATPAGRLYYQLAASGRRTSGQGSGGMQGWMTPKAKAGKYQYSQGNHQKIVLNLEGQAELARPVRPDNYLLAREEVEKISEGLEIAEARVREKLAGWATPAAQEPGNNPNRYKGGRRTAVTTNADFGEGLTQQTAGLTPNGSTVGTGSGGESLVLNPEFVRWLQGYPEEWGNSAPTGTASSPRSRRSSSKR